MSEKIDLTVTYTDVDLVKLEFFQGSERVLWIDLSRDKAVDWAEKIQKAAGLIFQTT